MEPILIPTQRFDELDADTRKVMLTIVRMFVNQQPEIKRILGIDCAEEGFIDLIDKGIIKLKIDEEDNIHLGFYDFDRYQYVYPSLGDEWKL